MWCCHVQVVWIRKERVIKWNWGFCRSMGEVKVVATSWVNSFKVNISCVSFAGQNFWVYKRYYVWDASSITSADFWGLLNGLLAYFFYWRVERWVNAKIKRIRAFSYFSAGCGLGCLNLKREYMHKFWANKKEGNLFFKIILHWPFQVFWIFCG